MPNRFRAKIQSRGWKQPCVHKNPNTINGNVSAARNWLMPELIIKEVSSELLKYTHSLICTFDPFCVSPLIFHPYVCDQLASDNLWHRGTANPLVTKSTRSPCHNKAHVAQALQRHNHKVESTCVSSKHKKAQKYMSHKQEAQNTCRKGT